MSKNWIDFGKRTLASLISVSIVLLLLIFAFQPWLSWVLYLVIATLAGVAIWEYSRFVKDKGGELSFPLLLFVTALLLFAFFTQSFSPLFPLILGTLLIGMFHFQEKRGAILDLACSWFALFYIAVPLGMMLAILYYAPEGAGQWWLAYLLAVTKMTDVGAYLGGKLFGERKLAPVISPGKTVEGAVCGLFFTLGTSFLFFAFSPLHLGSLEWIVFGIIFSFVSLFGDLFESLLKRDAHRKDSNSLPGFGGALDLLDSLLCTTPILYLYLLR
ncbi:MAG TPA: phosphatidate cytidylyltransferase [Chlamydiales bacterium]|nr:phosphatidate cytidylyltransferase [Chlamydiales bacterium]